jgi:hypothetical protein
MPSTNGLLIIAIKPNAKENFEKPPYLFYISYQLSRKVFQMIRTLLWGAHAQNDDFKNYYFSSFGRKVDEKKIKDA